MRPVLLLAAAALFSSGCIVAAAPAPPLDGTFAVDWSIDGIKDPNLCFQSSASSIEVDVYPSGSAGAYTFDAPCDAFFASTTLPPGNYDASAVLVDVNGRPRTTTVYIDPFVILGDDELDVPIDFPANAFL